MRCRFWPWISASNFEVEASLHLFVQANSVSYSKLDEKVAHWPPGKNLRGVIDFRLLNVAVAHTQCEFDIKRLDDARLRVRISHSATETSEEDEVCGSWRYVRQKQAPS